MSGSGGRQRVVVSGASSFLGRRLIARLHDDGAAIATVTRRGFEPDGCAPADLNMVSTSDDLIDRLVEFAPTAFVHMAAAGGFSADIDDVPALLEATVGVGCRLLEASARLTPRPTPFVAIGSFSERAVHDGHVFPASLYSATKAALTPYLEYYQNQRGVPSVVLQPTDIYGAGDTRTRFLNLVAGAIETSEPLDATEGEQIVSFVHVDDVCAAIVSAIASLQDRTVSIGPVPQYTVAGERVGPLRGVVDDVLDELDEKPEIRWGRRPYREGEVMVADFLSAIPEWSPRVTLADGLHELLGRGN